MAPTFLSTPGEPDATMAWEMLSRRVVMISTTRPLEGLAQSVRLIPSAPRVYASHHFFVGKDFDFSQSFFADDAPAKQPAPEPRQNAFDRDPLLDSRSHLASEYFA